MDTYYNFMAHIFAWAAPFAGALLIVFAVVTAWMWAAWKIGSLLSSWRVVLLTVAVRCHGKNYAEHYFWRALDEKLKDSQSKGGFDVRQIIKLAERHLPPNAELSRRQPAKRDDGRA